MIVSLVTLFYLGLAVDARIITKRGICPMHYKTGPNEQCFRFAEDRKNFDQARKQCESEGALLANTQSPEYYRFAQQQIDANPAKANIDLIFGLPALWVPWDNGFWVGATREGHDFRWFDGQKVAGHWCPLMPDNAFGAENCLEQMGGTTGWNDRGCHVKLRYVCQRKVVDPCDGVRCGHGRCVADGNRGVCLCSEGFTGSDCAVVRDVCKGVVCRNGRCVDQSGVGVCECDAGFTGTACQTATVVDRCANKPCLNGGDCFSNGEGYFCKCRGNFNGDNCEKSCRYEVAKSGLPAKLDAMILFDGSMSVGEGNFKKSLEFIARFADKLELGANKARVEIAQFSHEYVENLGFAASTKLTKDALRAKIAGIEYLKGGTMTGRALNRAFSAFSGSGRKAKEVAKYLVVLTDGSSADRAKIPGAIAKLESLGVHLVAVGVGDSIQRDELKVIAGGKDENVFSVDSFDQLDGALISKMVKKLCD